MKPNEKRAGSSRRMRALYALRASLVPSGVVPLEDALRHVSSMALQDKRKFDETVSVSLHLNVDAKNSANAVRGVVSLPHGIGRTFRVLAIVSPDFEDEARASGAEWVGGVDLIEKIQSGFMDFDRCVGTPDMMASIGKLAKILGPRGLMPNPKMGTLTQDIGQAVRLAKAGQVSFKMDKSALIHAPVGKASFSVQALLENARAFVAAVQVAKPASVKNIFMLKMHVGSTMAPSIAVDISSI